MGANSIRFDASLNDKVSGPLDKLRGKVDALGKTGAGKGFLAGFAGAATLGAIGLVSGAIGGVIDKLGEAQVAYREDEASQSRLRTSLQANVAAFDGNTDAIEKVLASRVKLGFSDDEQRASLSQLVTRTNDSAKALELQRTAMDLARLKGIDLASATTIIGKVYSGNIGALTRAGIAVDKNATATEALAAVQKAATGQAEAFANTSGGRVLASQLRVSDAMERVGLVVAKISDAILPVLADGFEAFVNLLGDVGREVEGFIKSNQGLFDILGSIASLIGTVLIGVFERFRDAGIAVWGAISTAVSTVFDVIKGVVGGIIGAIRNVMDIAAQVPGPWQESAVAMRDSLNEMQASVESWGTSTATVTDETKDAVVATATEMPPAVAGAMSAGETTVETGAQTMMGKVVDVTSQAKRDAVGIMATTPGAIAQSLNDGKFDVEAAWAAMNEVAENTLSKGEEIAKIKSMLTSDRFKAGLNAKRPEVRAEFEKWKADAEERLFALQNNVPEIAADTGQDYATVLEQKKGEVRLGAYAMSQPVKDEVEKVKKATSGLGSGTVSGYAGAITKGEGKVRKSSRGIVRAARGPLESADWDQYGRNISRRVAYGMDNESWRVAAAAEGVAEEIIAWIGVLSPTKKGPLSEHGGVEGYGSNVTTGYAGGMLRPLRRVQSAASSIAKAAIPNVRLPSLPSMSGGMSLAGSSLPSARAAGGGGMSLNLTYAPQFSTASPNEARTFASAVLPEFVRELDRQQVFERRRR